MALFQGTADSRRAGYAFIQDHSGAIWLAIALVGVVAYFWTGLTFLVQTWSTAEYSHGYAIPLVALYLFLSQLSREGPQPETRPPARWLGVTMVILAVGVGMLGNLAHIPHVIAYALVLCIAGLVFIAMGTRRGLRYWVPLFYLVFMLPLPSLIYLRLSSQLQLISSEFGTAVIALFGIPVFLEGNIIDLGVYKLQVAEACSGLRYLFPLISLGFLFAVLYKGPRWHKVVLFLAPVPITVLMNSVRIGIIGVLVDRYGVEHAEGFLHYFEGWVIFVTCIAILYLLAVVLQRFAKNPQPVHGMLELNLGELTSQFGRIQNIRATRTLMLTCLAVIVAGLTWHAMPARATIEPERIPFVSFPLSLADWSGQRVVLDAETERALAADDYLLVDYVNDGGQVNFYSAYYKTLLGGRGIHTPEECIPSGGWEISDLRTLETGVRMPTGEPLTVNRAIIERGINRQLVYYWFEQRGRSMASNYVAKAYTTLDATTRQRSDGALVRVITPLKPGEPIAAADNRLRGFLEVALPALPRFIPH
jgi:exosortase D (VPLPA-CTERM-specific)